jgi:hypothetical protein
MTMQAAAAARNVKRLLKRIARFTSQLVEYSWTILLMSAQTLEQGEVDMPHRPELMAVGD